MEDQVHERDDLGEDEDDGEVRMRVVDDIIDQQGDGVCDDSDRGDKAQAQNARGVLQGGDLAIHRHPHDDFAQPDADRDEEDDALVDQADGPGCVGVVRVDRAQQGAGQARHIEDLIPVGQEHPDEQHDDEERAN